MDTRPVRRCDTGIANGSELNRSCSVSGGLLRSMLVRVAGFMPLWIRFLLAVRTNWDYSIKEFEMANLLKLFLGLFGF